MAKASRSSSSRIAEPPYLMTIVRPWNWRIYGSASMRVSALRTIGSMRVTAYRMYRERSWSSRASASRAYT